MSSECDRAALAGRYRIERELGAGGMAEAAERRNGGTAEGGLHV